MIATNAFKQSVVGTYTASDTVIEVNSISDTVGASDYLPNGGFNLILYDGIFGNPADANNGGDYEILECSSVNYATNEITVVRARENTTAVIIDASSWQIIYGATVSFFDQFEDADATILKEANVVNTLDSTSTIAPLSANQGKELEDTKLPLAGGTMTGDLRVNARLTVDHKVIEQTFTGADFSGNKRFRLRLNANTTDNGWFVGSVRFMASQHGSNIDSVNRHNADYFDFITGGSENDFTSVFERRLQRGGFTSITFNRLARNDMEILMERDFTTNVRSRWVMHVSVTRATTLTTLTLTMEDVV